MFPGEGKDQPQCAGPRQECTKCSEVPWILPSLLPPPFSILLPSSLWRPSPPCLCSCLHLPSQVFSLPDEIKCCSLIEGLVNCAPKSFEFSIKWPMGGFIRETDSCRKSISFLRWNVSILYSERWQQVKIPVNIRDFWKSQEGKKYNFVVFSTKWKMGQEVLRKDSMYQRDWSSWLQSAATG